MTWNAEEMRGSAQGTLSVDVTTFDGYTLKIDCDVAEEGLRITPCLECA